MPDHEQRLGADELASGAVIHTSSTDDPDFLALAVAALRGLLTNTSLERLVLVHVDSWFGTKWLDFAGKSLGAVARWQIDDRLVIPPFVPPRVIDQSGFERRGESFVPAEFPPLHRVQQSWFAQHRYVQDLAPGAVLAWYSGATVRNGRGSLMCYVPTERGTWTWYAEWRKGAEWRLVSTKGVTREVLAQLIEGGSTRPM